MSPGVTKAQYGAWLVSQWFIRYQLFQNKKLKTFTKEYILYYSCNREPLLTYCYGNNILDNHNDKFIKLYITYNIFGIVVIEYGGLYKQRLSWDTGSEVISRGPVLLVSTVLQYMSSI